MSKILGTIDEDGFPVIPEVTIINPLTNTGIKAASIIDTGAVELHIKEDLVKQLDLEKIDGAFSLHPIHGRQPVAIYKVALSIQGIELGTLLARTMLGDFPFDVIIGCGFLKDRKMVYDGGSKTVEITF